MPARWMTCDKRRQLVAAIKPQIEAGEVVGLPAVLGVRDLTAWSDIADQLGAPVFEIPLPPPGVPGIRINEALTNLAKDLKVRVIVGNRVIDHSADGNTINVASSSIRQEATRGTRPRASSSQPAASRAATHDGLVRCQRADLRSTAG